MVVTQREAELIAGAAARLSAGEGVDDVIHYLKDSGLDLSDSIWALAQTGLISAAEAKHAVFQHPDWVAARTAAVELHKEIAEAIEETGSAE